MSPPIHLGVMQVELDHLFVCTAAGGPEAQRLLQFGLNEAPPNVHPGQGTANRRFAFSNAMIELLWVDNPAEAQSQATARTLLWERWSRRSEGSCPFGICVRPVDIPPTAPPFPGWEYRPVYLPPPLSMHIGEAGVEEPMWVYLNFITRTQRQKWFHEHSSDIQEITRVVLHTPVPVSSSAARRLVEAGVVHTEPSAGYALEIEFDHNRKGQRIDLGPDLPVVLRL
jgi:Glyoxalase-like domain